MDTHSSEDILIVVVVVRVGRDEKRGVCRETKSKGVERKEDGIGGRWECGPNLPAAYPSTFRVHSTPVIH